MNRKHRLVVFGLLALLCATIQVAQQTHHARWQRGWDSLFDRVSALQTAIDMLEVEDDSAGKLQDLQRQQSEVMTEIRTTFHPNLIPGWAQALASLGLIIGIVGLWKMKKPRDTEQ